MSGSFVLIPKSTWPTRESVDLNINGSVILGHLTSVNLAGRILVPRWNVNFVTNFDGFEFLTQSESTILTLGHPGKLWCKLHHGLLPWLWIYLGIPDPPVSSVNALFPSGCWSLVGWRQLSVSKPLRSTTAHGSRVNKRDLVHLLSPSSQKFPNFPKSPWLCLS